MVMSTVKITQRLHLWAEFDGAFMSLAAHSKVLSARLNVYIMENVDGWLNVYLTTAEFFSCLLRCRLALERISTRKWHFGEFFYELGILSLFCIDISFLTLVWSVQSSWTFFRGEELHENIFQL